MASPSYIHSGTPNIFSHLIPAVFIVVAQVYLWQVFWIRFPDASQRDYSIFAFHALTATSCFGLSAAYHTLINHSERVLDLWSRLDYVGIIFLILGNFVSGIYVGFYCEPHLQWTYWTMVSTPSSSLATDTLSPALTVRADCCLWSSYGIVGSTSIVPAS